MMVWLLQPGDEPSQGSKWNHSILFQDDRSKIDGGAMVIILAIDLSTNSGKNEEWLWIIGPVTKAVLDSRIPL